MSKSNKKAYRLPIGILLHGKKIWISELLSYLFAATILGIFMVLGIIVLMNELKQAKLAGSISSMHKEAVELGNTCSILQQKNRIHKILTKFAKKKVSDTTIQTLTNVLYSNSRQFGYDPLLLLAVINVESVFNPKALGRFRSGNLSGAMGLMQLKFATAQETAAMLNITLQSPEDLLKPDINLILGTAYLAKLISRFRSFKLGIIAYNIGPEKVKSTMRNKEELPLNYYKKVLHAYYTLEQFIATDTTIIQ